MADLSFACPKCQIVLGAKVQMVGHDVQCPSCHCQIRIPPVPPDALVGNVPPLSMSTEPSDKPTRQCPFCGEDILPTAIKCKHCGEFLEGGSAESHAPRVNPIDQSRFGKVAWTVSILVGVLALLMWGGGRLFDGQSAASTAIEAMRPYVKISSARLENVIRVELPGSNGVTYEQVFQLIDSNSAQIEADILAVQTLVLPAATKVEGPVLDYLRSIQDLLRIMRLKNQKEVELLGAEKRAEEVARRKETFADLYLSMFSGEENEGTKSKREVQDTRRAFVEATWAMVEVTKKVRTAYGGLASGAFSTELVDPRLLDELEELLRTQAAERQGQEKEEVRQREQDVEDAKQEEKARKEAQNVEDERRRIQEGADLRQRAWSSQARRSSSSPTGKNPPEVDPQFRRRFQPEYPPTSRRLGEEGTVVLRVLVGTDGRVMDAKVQDSSGFPRLDEAALRHATRAWSFIPATEDGELIAAWCAVKVTFKIVD